MVFSSFLFIFVFLPSFLALYYLLPSRARNWVALLFSLFFYAWGAPQIIPLLVLGSWVDFIGSRYLSTAKPYRWRRCYLCLLVGLNLALLGWYKYSNFFVGEVNHLLAFFNYQTLAWSPVLLPVGISFFTFQKITYLVDVYWGLAPPAKRYRDYLLYIVFFPQLIAGPIVRYLDVAVQLEQRTHSLEKFYSGLLRFCVGLGKKVLIADTLGTVADNVFTLEPGIVTGAYAWLAVTCYAFQIYFDFSGYSDMAIGLARMAGFEFLENFNHPYAATSVTDFWRRWHISLTNFMREYLYVPLGGNRCGRLRTYLNLWLVFLFSGLWHGAAWTFVVWGAYHGLLLSVERAIPKRWTQAVPAACGQIYMFLAVLIGWVFFRSQDLPQALGLLAKMFSFPQLFDDLSVPAATIIHNRAWVVLYVAMLVSFAPALPFVKSRQLGAPPVSVGTWKTVVASSSALILFVLSLMMLASAGFSPFLYFRF